MVSSKIMLIFRIKSDLPPVEYSVWNVFENCLLQDVRHNLWGICSKFMRCSGLHQMNLGQISIPYRTKSASPKGHELRDTRMGIPYRTKSASPKGHELRDTRMGIPYRTKSASPKGHGLWYARIGTQSGTCRLWQ